VEEQCGLRVLGEVPALAALEIRIEDEAALVEALEQHHARRRPARCVGRREGHGVGVIGLARLGLLQPRGEAREGLGLPHLAARVLGADFRILVHRLKLPLSQTT
jgi:hypothetical protein